MSWGGIFGSAAGLITLFICFMINVPFEVLVGRVTVAGLLGALAGVIVGYLLGAIAAMKEKQAAEGDDKGGRVDFTVGEDEPVVRAGGVTRPPGERLTGGGEAEAFQPLDLKSSARQIQSLFPE
jgi:hypothetical protein